MTQNWGGPNTGPQWNGQQAWNRPQNTWGTPTYPPPPPPPPASPPGYPPPPEAPPSFSPPGGYLQPGSFPPPKRTRPLPAILAGAAFIVIAAFFFITVSNYLNDGGSGTGGGHQVTNVPAPDFNPPPLPAPETYEQAENWLTANAIYDESVPVPTDCAVPYLNTKTASPEKLEIHLNELTKCLWGVWIDPMTAAGFELPRPPVTVYSSSVTTACGDAEAGNAFYCAADQHIYYATDLYQLMPRQLQTQPFVSDVVMAHEFGHAIQARTGILISEKALEQEVSNASAKELSRRTEVQADCMAGLFTNAVSDASKLSGNDVNNLKTLIYNIGDDILTGDPSYDGDHGSGKNRESWFAKGLETAQIGVCNSYTAPSRAVR